jgi:hypothetical protein
MPEIGQNISHYNIVEKIIAFASGSLGKTVVYCKAADGTGEDERLTI